MPSPGISAQKKRRIRELRARGLTVAQVAERTGVSTSTVIRHTTGVGVAGGGGNGPVMDEVDASSTADATEAQDTVDATLSSPDAAQPGAGGANVERRFEDVETAVSSLQADVADLRRTVNDISRLLNSFPEMTADYDRRMSELDGYVRAMGHDLTRIKGKKPKLFK
jgi:hypothetical protein